MAKTDKLIEVKLTHDEICDLINGLTVKSLSQGLDKESKALGQKLSIALKKVENGDGEKA
jgi:hypothetical protein|tara:strand:- start:127 stop:306 length:180 start_codon:yes stop_codon:yes gene_type:complete